MKYLVLLCDGMADTPSEYLGGKTLYQFCLDYERPAINNVDARYAFALDFFGQLAGGSDPDPQPAPAPQPSPSPAGFDWKIAQMQFIMQLDGYWDDPIDGLKSPKFFKQLWTYIEDMEGC